MLRRALDHHPRSAICRCLAFLAACAAAGSLWPSAAFSSSPAPQVIDAPRVVGLAQVGRDLTLVAARARPGKARLQVAWQIQGRHGWRSIDGAAGRAYHVRTADKG